MQELSFIAEVKEVKQMIICKVENCNEKKAKTIYCNKHYIRMRRNGTPDKLRIRRVGVVNCSLEDCTNKIKATELCSKHYYRRTKYGSPYKTSNYRGGGNTKEESFWNRVSKKTPTDCWEWTRKVDKEGYGICDLFNLKNAHRVAYYLAKGKIAKGMSVMHSCDNPPCCNPNHLSLGTHALNMREAALKGRIARGNSHSKAKLTESDVRNIRKRYRQGESIRELLDKYSFISYRNLYKAAIGETWKHL